MANITNKLLTALLIAGLSATAKAEPVVYYCEMRGFIDLMPDGEVKRYKLERFPMKIEGNNVSFGGDGFLKDSENTLKSNNPENGYFTYVGEGYAAVFFDNLLRITWHNYLDGEITAIVARCDNF